MKMLLKDQIKKSAGRTYKLAWQLKDAMWENQYGREDEYIRLLNRININSQKWDIDIINVINLLDDYRYPENRELFMQPPTRVVCEAIRKSKRG